MFGAGRPSSAIVGQRWKHSSTQIKRLFKKNPARERVERRLAPSTETPIPQLRFPVHQDVEEPFPNGWSPPLSPDKQVQRLPFSVSRTRKSSGIGFLPVYSESRRNGSKITTRIKRVSGDMETFLEELRAALNIPTSKNPQDDCVRIRTGGTIEVDGNRVSEVKRWLQGLGF